ncbi:MAG: thiamine pyrophosphate-dependent enzyme, partial [Myxococcota bacterium]
MSPVVCGRVRAKQDRLGDVNGAKVMGIVIHGDAAFAGQGVVQETFNMSGLDGYNTGGTLHIIVNNQIGFTTNPEDGRSTQYATDVAKMLQVPIFHVNGEHPDSVAQAVKLAMEFREAFRKDVVIDMYCYRRYGHNEGDEPAFTQPEMYRKIRKRKTVREAYLDNLYKLGEIGQDEADRVAVERRERLERELGLARAPDFVIPQTSFGEGNWEGFVGGTYDSVPEAATAVPKEQLVRLLESIGTLPEDLKPHSKVKRLFGQRVAASRGEQALDWAAGELLAYATLLNEGRRVRLAGQDSRRGTFSHRHAFVIDGNTGRAWSPLSELADGE